MAKKRNDQQDRNQEQSVSALPRTAVYPGGFLFLIGLAAFYMSGKANPGMFTWHSYVSIILMILGAILWFTAGMTRRQIFEWLRSAAIALFVALAIRWALVEPYRIPSGSMETTLHGDPGFGKGDRVFVNKWFYGIRFPFMNKRMWTGAPPERWDLVVFKSVEEDAIHKTLVKRIVGMPGEKILIRDGQVFVDGTALEIPDSLPEHQVYTSPLGAPYGVVDSDAYTNIPDDSYLVLGDNSAHSRDGRYFGWLPSNHIVGRVSCIWWPPPRWRDFTGFSKTLWWKISVAIVLILIALRLFFYRLCAIPVSEQNKDVDHLLVSFIRYGLHIPLLRGSPIRWRKPARGDLVFYSAKVADTKEWLFLVGRIAATPGEQVGFENGALLINDTPMTLPAPAPKTYESIATEAPYGRNKSKAYSVVPENSYFILSDAQGSSDMTLDSRICGWVPESDIQGKISLCWWPLKRRGKR